MLRFLIRTYKKVGFGRLRYTLLDPYTLNPKPLAIINALSYPKVARHLELRFGVGPKPKHKTLKSEAKEANKRKKPKKHPNINFWVGYPCLIAVLATGVMAYRNRCLLA